MAPRRRKAPPCSVDLPEPVWAAIASHMALKDWAKAAGTCKRSIGVQLHTVNIPPDTPPAGDSFCYRSVGVSQYCKYVCFLVAGVFRMCSLDLAVRWGGPAGVVWATKRMGALRVLRSYENGFLGLADAATQGQDNILKDLQQLEICALDADISDVLDSTAPQFMWLLSCAQKLTVLSASLEALPWLPPLLQLKHLVLRCEQHTFGALRNARNLETLSLSAGEYTRASILQLDSLASLRVVALHKIRPSGIYLPEACYLHISGLEEVLDPSKKGAWNGAITNLSSFGFSCSYRKISRLPGCFAHLQKLTFVTLELGQCGSSEHFLSLDGLGNVRKLRVSGKKLYLNVPSEVSWESVDFVGKRILDIAFADLEAFACTVSMCILQYGAPMGSCLSTLRSTLAARGVGWHTRKQKSGLCVFQYPVKIAANAFGCECGACMECLRALGVGDVPAAEWTEAEEVSEDEDWEDSSSSSDDDSDYFNDDDHDHGVTALTIRLCRCQREMLSRD